MEKLCDIITEAQDTNACLLEIKALLGEDTVEVIVDTECNDITGNYDFVTTTVTNGVAGTPVITDSGTPCTEDAPDYEQVSLCNTTTGNTHIITSTIIDGVITVLDDTDTGNKCTPTKVESDVEVVCNDDTDLQEYHIFEIVDGVTNPVPTIVPTTIACDEDKVDYEQVEVCRNGTTHIVTNSIIDDVVTEIDAIDTGVECCKGTPECVESQEWTYGIDNTGTTYDRPNAEYEITLSDGSTLTWTQTTASAA